MPGGQLLWKGSKQGTETKEETATYTTLSSLDEGSDKNGHDRWARAQLRHNECENGVFYPSDEQNRFYGFVSLGV